MSCCFGTNNRTTSSPDIAVSNGAIQEAEQIKKDAPKAHSANGPPLAAQIRADLYEATAFEGMAALKLQSLQFPSHVSTPAPLQWFRISCA